MICKQTDPENDSSIKAACLPDTGLLSLAQMDAELEKGYADISAGRAKDAKAAFADIHAEHPQDGK